MDVCSSKISASRRRLDRRERWGQRAGTRWVSLCHGCPRGRARTMFMDVLRLSSIAEKLGPVGRDPGAGHGPGDGPHAAVAAILRDGPEGVELFFIRRAESPTDPWSGHIVFPGGRRGPTLLATASARRRKRSASISAEPSSSRAPGRAGIHPLQARSSRRHSRTLPFRVVVEHARHRTRREPRNGRRDAHQTRGPTLVPEINPSELLLRPRCRIHHHAQSTRSQLQRKELYV